MIMLIIIRNKNTHTSLMEVDSEQMDDKKMNELDELYGSRELVSYEMTFKPGKRLDDAHDINNIKPGDLERLVITLNSDETTE